MDKRAIQQVAFHDRVAAPQSGVAKFSATLAALCANKLRRHLGDSERLQRDAASSTFEHSVPPEDWAHGVGGDSVWLTGFADAVDDACVALTLEVRAESAPEEAEPLARGKFVFNVSSATASGVADRRSDYALRELVNRGALTVAAVPAADAAARGTRTIRAFAATQALGSVIQFC